MYVCLFQCSAFRVGIWHSSGLKKKKMSLACRGTLDGRWTASTSTEGGNSRSRLLQLWSMGVSRTWSSPWIRNFTFCLSPMLCENLSAIVCWHFACPFPANLISTHQTLSIGSKRIMPREDQKIWTWGEEEAPMVATHVKFRLGMKNRFTRKLLRRWKTIWMVFVEGERIPTWSSSQAYCWLYQTGIINPLAATWIYDSAGISTSLLTTI